MTYDDIALAWLRKAVRVVVSNVMVETFNLEIRRGPILLPPESGGGASELRVANSPLAPCRPGAPAARRGPPATKKGGGRDLSVSS